MNIQYFFSNQAFFSCSNHKYDWVTTYFLRAYLIISYYTSGFALVYLTVSFTVQWLSSYYNYHF